MRNKFLDIGDPGYHPLRKFRIILSGLRYAVLFDLSVLYKLVISLVILVFAFMAHNWVDFGLIILATGFALSAELFNTAIEAVCDFLETKENEKIRVIKDIAAAAAGIGIFVWVVVIAASVVGLVFRSSS